MERAAILLSALVLATAAQAGDMDLWQSCGIPQSHTVQCLTVTPAGDLLAGTLEGGLFRSNDRAGTWTSLEDVFAGDNVLAMAVCPDGGILAATFGGGVFRSSDGGGSWLPMNDGLGDLEIITLATAGRRGVYAATARKGVYRCDGSGEGWRYVGLSGVITNALVVTPSGTIIAGTSGDGIMVSRDEGKSWLQANGRLRGRDVWAISVDEEGRIFAATNGGGVLRSDNGGLNWKQVNTGLADPYVGSLSVVDHEILAGTARGVFRSIDAGESWSPVNGGFSARAVKCLAASDGETIFVSTPRGGLFRRPFEEWSLQ